VFSTRGATCVQHNVKQVRGPADCANVHVVYSEVIVVRARQTTMFDLSDDSVFSNTTE